MRGSTPGLPILTCHRVGLPPPASTCRRLERLGAPDAERGLNDTRALDSRCLRRIAVKGYRLVHRARFTLAALRGFA